MNNKSIQQQFLNYKNQIAYYLPYILIFIFFILINHLTPRIFDDWEISTWLSNANGNLYYLLFRSPRYFWLTMNGRIINNTFQILFSYFKIVWNVLSAFVYVFIIYFYSNDRNLNTRLLLVPSAFLVLLSTSPGVRMETFSYLVANVTFFFEFFLILLFFIMMKKDFQNERPPFGLISLYLIFAFVIGSWVENLSIGFTVTLTICYISLMIKYRKNYPLLFIAIIGSLLGLAILLSSPGMRSVRSFSFSPQYFLENLKYNLSNNIELLILYNRPIFNLLNVSCFIAILTNGINIPKLLIKLSYMFFLLVITILLNTSYGFKFLSQNNIYLSLFWILYLLSFFYPVFLFKHKQNYAISSLLFAVMSFFPLFFIDQAGHRIIAVPLIIFGLISVIFIKHINFQSPITKRLLLIIILFMLSAQIINWFFIYTTAYKITNIREETINAVVVDQQLGRWDVSEDFVILPSYNENHILRGGKMESGTFHYLPFLRYFKLDEKTNVIFE